MGLGRDNSIKIDQMYVVCFTRSDSHLWLIKLINCYWIKLSISKSLLKGKMSMSAFGVVWFEGALDSLSNSTSNLGPPSRSQGGGEGERWRERSRKKGNPRDEVVSNRAEEYRPSARQRAPFSLFTHFRL